MHMAWVRQVCGRLKSDYRYSAKLVYNNYPWPASATDKQRAAVEAAAQTVLDARAKYMECGDSSPLSPAGDLSPASPKSGKARQSADQSAHSKTATLADLYDPLTMPAPLLQAHQALDRAVDRCYRGEAFASDRHRVEYLFALYEKITAPLVAAAKAKRKRKVSGTAK